MDETLSELKAMRDFFIAAIESSQKNIELRQKSINALNVAIAEIEKIATDRKRSGLREQDTEQKIRIISSAL